MKPSAEITLRSAHLWIVAAVWFMLGGRALAQCGNPAVLDNWEAPCGLGLHTGQSFIAQTTGYLDSVTLAVCTGDNAHVEIRLFNGTNFAWDQGALIGSSSNTIVGQDNINLCFTGDNQGLDHYEAATFSFEDVGLQEGVQYVIVLASGTAATGCTIDAPDGTAFVWNGASTEQDLVYTASICPAPLSFGCTDPAGCNYDATVDFENGSCTEPEPFYDCAGQCLSDADENGICDELEVPGCMDPTQCNYSSEATYDDGSCVTADCMGVCQGSAILDPDCGCIGGTSGIPVEACIADCTPQFLDHRSPSWSAGLRSGQSFTAPGTGLIQLVELTICRNSETRLNIRAFQEGVAWNEGPIVAQSIDTYPATSAFSCAISQAGFSAYETVEFHFDSVGLSAGVEYVIELESGVAAAQVNNPYNGGNSFMEAGPDGNLDLSFLIILCEADLTPGCTDDAACNYDENASLEDSSCLYEDCNGVCGGSAFEDPICGCLDNAADAGSCIGCMNPLACNFDPEATVSSATCSYPDCAGVCGGSAFNTPCGCIGGETGIPGHACIDGCLTDTEGASGPSCAPALLIGQGFVPEEDGLLKAIRLKVCCAVNAQLVLRHASSFNPCDVDATMDWNSGGAIDTSQVVSPTCFGMSNCLTSLSSTGYQWREFFFDNIPLQQGEPYVFELISGVAISSCTENYPFGHAYGNMLSLPEEDLSFTLQFCRGEGFTWGCMNASACNYDEQALQDDGSCQFLDCHGECGGTASETQGCGCIGGSTGIDEAQCIDESILPLLDNSGAPCGNTAAGQTLLPTDDGFLKSVNLIVPRHVDLTLQLSRENGPLAGLSLGSATLTAEPGYCEQSNRAWRAFDFGQMPIEGGATYRLTLVGGVASTSCGEGHIAGQALTANGSSIPFDDLLFKWVYRSPDPGELIWGCTDSEACNFTPDATHDNGTCLSNDCNGDCGGVAYEIIGCGCVEGNTGVTAESCYGCTDSQACNYDALASIDDGSCLALDCHGDCGGTAILDDQCGCIGGNSPVAIEQCLGKCEGQIAIEAIPQVNLEASTSLVFGGAGQTFIAEEDAFITGIKVLQAVQPSTTISVRLREYDGSFPSSSTLLLEEEYDEYLPEPFGGALFFEVDDPVLLSAGTTYSLQFIGVECVMIRRGQDVYPEGHSHSAEGASDDNRDLAFNLVTCNDLFGCMAENACNFAPWATAENYTCSYPAPGTDCSGDPCVEDNDGDGVCAANDADDNDINVCMDTDHDGCDDCSSGTFDPLQDGVDSDGDGYCDSGDLCSNLNADNYDDPENLPCRGNCDSAPIFDSLSVIQHATGPNEEDAILGLHTSAGNLLFVSESEFEATTLSLTGIYSGVETLLPITGDEVHVLPGWYEVRVFDTEGCQGVTAASYGSTFGMPEAQFTAQIRYILCCGSCGVHDVDLDGICDDVDNCIDRNAPNYNDSQNTPCD